MIDPLAVIDPAARLGKNVSVGPHSIIGPDVIIGDNTWIGPHVVIRGHTRIGRDNRIYQFASVGEEPQHKGYKGEPTTTEIGNRNIIREYVSIHRGTAFDKGTTRIGDDNMFMASTHIAHDCILGSNITAANGVTLAGHIEIGDYCFFSAFAMVHQFCRIGAHCFIGHVTGVLHDVPPFLMVQERRARPHGVNSHGLAGRGFDQERIRLIRQAYRILYRSNLSLADAIENLQEMAKESEDIRQFVEFCKGGKRGIIR